MASLVFVGSEEKVGEQSENLSDRTFRLLVAGVIDQAQVNCLLDKNHALAIFEELPYNRENIKESSLCIKLDPVITHFRLISRKSG